MAIDRQLLEVLLEQNPWHASGRVPDAFAKPVERTLGRTLWRVLIAAEPKRFQVVLGPRRVGKTTVLYQTVRHLLRDAGLDRNRVWWMRLDHPQLLRTRLDRLVRQVVEFSGATTEQPVYLMLDELVYAENWDLWLKTFYDDAWPVRIAATSSATAALRDRRHESGVGRWAEQYLTPYSFGEFLALREIRHSVEAGTTLSDSLQSIAYEQSSTPDEIARYRRLFLLVGGFPELLSALRTDADRLVDELLESQQVLRTDAVERAVYKDIPQTFGVDNPMMLERLLYVMAAHMTGLISPTGLAKELEMAQPTVDRYLSYLEQAFLVFTLTNYSGREASVQKRGRKLFFFDGAIRNAALQRGTRPISDSQETGALIENLVAATLRTAALQSDARLHFWRDKRAEVDFVFDQPSAELAIEVGSSDGHSRAGLQAFGVRYLRFRNRCWLVTPDSPYIRPEQSMSGVGSIPLDRFLLAASAQAERDLVTRLGRAARVAS